MGRSVPQMNSGTFVALVFPKSFNHLWAVLICVCLLSLPALLLSIISVTRSRSLNEQMNEALWRAPAKFCKPRKLSVLSKGYQSRSSHPSVQSSSISPLYLGKKSKLHSGPHSVPQDLAQLTSLTSAPPRLCIPALATVVSFLFLLVPASWGALSVLLP